MRTSKPSARSRLSSGLRLTSLCDIEFHPVLNCHAVTWGEASALVAVTPRDGKECTGRNRIEGQGNHLLKGGRWSRHLLRPSVNNDVDLMLFRHIVPLLCSAPLIAYL